MPDDPIGSRLDVTAGAPSSTPSTSRPFLQVLFNCCKVYQRIYQTPDGKKYTGRCPRCGQSVTFTVGPGGTDARQFIVD
jgi:hypothetical protein